MTHGARAKQVIDAAREKGTPIPKAIADAPIPEDDYQVFVFSAFETLSTCRHVIPGAIGPIPWSAIDQFAHRSEFANDEIAYADFTYLIQELDEVFLEIRGKELAAERDRIANGKSGQVRPATRRHRSRR